jgi:hypothetical protein
VFARKHPGKEKPMIRLLSLALITLAILAALIYPGLVPQARPGDPAPPAEIPAYSPARQTLTFTVVATTYLPIVLNPAPPPNILEITALQPETGDEYIEITNHGPGDQDLTGWQIYSVIGDQTYDFPAGYILVANSAVRIHSGSGAINNPPADLLWATLFIWNNAGDAAHLRDNTLTIRDQTCYGNAC